MTLEFGNVTTIVRTGRWWFLDSDCYGLYFEHTLPATPAAVTDYQYYGGLYSIWF
jgi:hypothetical protein